MELRGGEAGKGWIVGFDDYVLDKNGFLTKEFELEEGFEDYTRYQEDESPRVIQILINSSSSSRRSSFL